MNPLGKPGWGFSWKCPCGNVKDVCSVPGEERSGGVCVQISGSKNRIQWETRQFTKTAEMNLTAFCSALQLGLNPVTTKETRQHRPPRC